MKEDALELGGDRPKYFRFLPDDGAPKAVVHVVHGLAEHAARYRRLAEALVGEGWAVYAHDQRGHGRTAKGDDDLGFFAERDGWAVAVADLRALIEREKAEHSGLPIAVLGHSMGSLIIQDYLSRYAGADLAAAALSGTSGPPPAVATVGRLVARFERLRLGPRGRSALIDNLAFGAYNKPFEPARTGFDWLSRDPDEVDAYVADPWCGFKATNQLWIDLLDALSTLAKPDRLARFPKELPIYMFSGDRDPVGLNGEGVRQLESRYRDAGLKSVQVKLYREARHEVLNEINRDEVTADLIAWLKPRLEGA